MLCVAASSSFLDSVFSSRTYLWCFMRVSGSRGVSPSASVGQSKPPVCSRGVCMVLSRNSSILNKPSIEFPAGFACVFVVLEGPLLTLSFRFITVVIVISSSSHLCRARCKLSAGRVRVLIGPHRPPFSLLLPPAQLAEPLHLITK